MLSRGTVCVHDVTHLTGNWVTMFIREKLPSLSNPLCNRHILRKTDHSLDVDAARDGITNGWGLAS